MAVAPAAIAAMRELWHDTELSAAEIGALFSVSRSTVLGLAHRQDWSARGECRLPPVPTIFERLDQLHARMDRVLAETAGVGRIKAS